MEEQNELLDSQNETENLDSQIEVEEVDVEALKQEKEKLAEQNKQLFERAKKAELELKKAKPVEQPKESEVPKKSEDGYSLEDTIAIINEKVVEKEDIETVKKFAKLEGISISEALKSPIVKGILSAKAEERKTAQATNTAVSRRASSKVSGEDLLEKFNKGDIPEKEEDLSKVIEARWSPKEK